MFIVATIAGLVGFRNFQGRHLPSHRTLIFAGPQRQTYGVSPMVGRTPVPYLAGIVGGLVLWIVTWRGGCLAQVAAKPLSSPGGQIEKKHRPEVFFFSVWRSQRAELRLNLASKPAKNRGLVGLR